MTERACVTGCGRPTGEFLCRSCTDQLVSALRSLIADGTGRGLLAELGSTLTRQAVFAPTVAVHAAGRPLPYHQAASELSWIAGNTLSTWARDVAEHNPHLAPPSGSSAELAGWLADVPGLLALHPAADELHDELTHLAAEVRRMVDRPAEAVYAGPCQSRGCAEHLYANPQSPYVACRGCGTVHDVADCQAAMVAEAASLRVTANTALSWAALLLDVRVPRGTFDSWVSRRRLLAHGTDAGGHPVYRFGEVRDLVLAYVRKRHAVA